LNHPKAVRVKPLVNVVTKFIYKSLIFTNNFGFIMLLEDNKHIKIESHIMRNRIDD